jgi:hypothetical protein
MDLSVVLEAFLSIAVVVSIAATCMKLGRG